VLVFSYKHEASHDLKETISFYYFSIIFLKLIFLINLKHSQFEIEK
jgi:hypothetical protein